MTENVSIFNIYRGIQLMGNKTNNNHRNPEIPTSLMKQRTSLSFRLQHVQDQIMREIGDTKFVKYSPEELRKILTLHLALVRPVNERLP